ncbi:MAG: hypothetical protein GXP48_08250 [Acidobacteria bacterium]|nr:hypothetical protein [Acidobacteriota bacterium]
MTLSTESFNSFVSALNLVMIRTVRVKHRAEEEFRHADVKQLKLDYSASYTNTDHGFVAEAAYTLKLVGPRRKVFGRTVIVFRVYYTTPNPMTDEIFEVFGNRSLKVQTWPYLREIFQNLSWRSNWPPASLPILKIGLPEHPDGEPNSDLR